MSSEVQVAKKSGKSELQQRLDEWRENAQHMYERLDTVSLYWPSLTTQWCLNDTEGVRALVATYSLGAETDYVREVEVDTDKLRPQDHQLRSWAVPSESNETKTENTPEIQKLRQCPQQPEIFAGFSAQSGDIFVFSKSQPECLARLEGHAASGFGLAWSPKNKLQLVSGSEDGLLLLWQLSVEEANGKVNIKYENITKYDTGSIVNEVTWDHADQIVAALENGHVLILNAQLGVAHDLECHPNATNTACLSPFAPHLLATGAADHRLRLWNTRTGELLYENFTHEKSINCVRWSPHIDGVLASAAMDGVVYLWDIRKIGQDQPHEDVEDGAAELLFKHNGHLKGDQVQEIDWHPTIPWLMLSCDGRNALMSWKPNDDAVTKPDAPEMPSFLI